jgi:hypothetical protein
MSGGSYDYIYQKIEDLAHNIRSEGCCSCASPAKRKAFARHLSKVAAAMKAIEWNDSCDGDDNEERLIMAVISPQDVLIEATKEASSICRGEKDE